MRVRHGVDGAPNVGGPDRADQLRRGDRGPQAAGQVRRLNRGTAGKTLSLIPRPSVRPMRGIGTIDWLYRSNAPTLAFYTKRWSTKQFCMARPHQGPRPRWSPSGTSLAWTSSIAG